METDPDLSSLPHSARLPGTYAAHYEREADPRRGQIVFIVFAALGLLWETLDFLVISYWAQKPGAGSMTAPIVLATITHLSINLSLLFAIVLGATWARWPLVALDFLSGAWFLLYTFVNQLVYLGLPFLPTILKYGIPPLVGAVYLARAAWFGLGADFIAFARRQRERMGAAGPVGGSVLAGVALVVPACGFGTFYYLGSRLLAAQRELQAEQRDLSMKTVYAGSDVAARRAIEAIVGSGDKAAAFARWLDPRFLRNPDPRILQSTAAEASSAGALRAITRVELEPAFSRDWSQVIEGGKVIFLAEATYRISTECEKRPALFRVSMIRAQTPEQAKAEPIPQPDDWLVTMFTATSVTK